MIYAQLYSCHLPRSSSFVWMDYPGSLAWDLDISLVRRVFLVKSVPTSAHTQLNCVLCISVDISKRVALFFHGFEFMAGSVVASA